MYLLKRILGKIFSIKTLVVVLVLFIGLPLLGLAAFKVECSIANKGLPNIAESKTDLVEVRGVEKYERLESKTFLTFPEWYIVYSAQEYAQYLANNKPSSFPYFSSVEQYWRSYCNVYELTKNNYGFSQDDHITLSVIGVSYTLEMFGKGIYENTIGRVFELFSNYPTQEDAYAQKVAQEYGDFLPTVPWYEFDFGKKLAGVWSDNSATGQGPLRKWERKVVLSVEYALKAVYGGIIKKATKATFGDQDLYIKMVIEKPALRVYQEVPQVRRIQEVNSSYDLVEVPRFQDFTLVLPQLFERGVKFIEIAGNNEIFMTFLSPRESSIEAVGSQRVYKANILTDSTKKRVGFKVDVSKLSEVYNVLTDSGLEFEHIYDY